MTKALIDTNICLDGVLHRWPFAINALKLVEHSQMGNFEGIVAAHSFDTLFYLLNKRIGKIKTYKGIKILRDAYHVAAVTEQVIDKAIEAEWKDFEDAIHHQAAKSAGCQAIITRNKKDFKDADISVLSPVEFLAELS